MICLIFVLFSLSSVVLCQTHFTLPENVWRISFHRSISTDTWVGKGGEKGFPDEFFTVSAPFYGADSSVIAGYITNPQRERVRREVSFALEHGIARRLTFLMEIPYFTTYSVSNTWSWKETGQDSLTADQIVDSLMNFYHPDRSTSGLGDIRWALIVLLYGSPAWSGESILSVYGSVGLEASTGRTIGRFDPSDLDSTGRPSQFNQLSLGKGVTQWQFSLFGEFYRQIVRRLTRINWQIQYWLNIEDNFWTRVTPRETHTLDHDAILGRLGRVYRHKPGDVLSATIFGFLEIVPDRLSVSAGQSWRFKLRDRYNSGSDDWDEWMEGETEERLGYSTRTSSLVQSASILFHNYHPLKKIGPIPFEVEARVDVPFLTRFTWSTLAYSLSISIYHQMW
ncbi:MAG: hypothetical protein V3U24_05680 [Candidatus Neomarinimicrobiota bacterium]